MRERRARPGSIYCIGANKVAALSLILASLTPAGRQILTLFTSSSVDFVESSSFAFFTEWWRAGGGLECKVLGAVTVFCVRKQKLVMVKRENALG